MVRLADDSRGPLTPHEPQHALLDEAGPDELREPLARAEWQRVMDIVRNTGHLQAVDRATFLAYCLKYAPLLQVEAEAAKHPFIVKGVNSGRSSSSAIRNVTWNAIGR
jgi:phage terminase small subunit